MLCGRIARASWSRYIAGMAGLTLPSEQAQAVRDALRIAASDAGSLRAWATAHDIAPAYAWQVATGRRPPSDAILDALGLELAVRKLSD